MNFRVEFEERFYDFIIGFLGCQQYDTKVTHDYTLITFKYGDAEINFRIIYADGEIVIQIGKYTKEIELGRNLEETWSLFLNNFVVILLDCVRHV